jgi:urea transport system permease protein
MTFLWLRRLWLGVLLGLGLGAAHALTPADALAVAAGDGDDRIAAINRLAADADERTLALLQALGNGAVKVQGEQVLLIADDGGATDAVTGAAVTLSDSAEDSMVNNRLRGALEAALSVRDLFGNDAAAQRAAAAMLQKAAFDEPDAAQLPLVEKALANSALDPRPVRRWSWHAPPCNWPARTRHSAWPPHRPWVTGATPRSSRCWRRGWKPSRAPTSRLR